MEYFISGRYVHGAVHKFSTTDGEFDMDTIIFISGRYFMVDPF